MKGVQYENLYKDELEKWRMDFCRQQGNILGQLSLVSDADTKS